jgi:putative colanic acid biosynthesis acetyltransferase WcaF
MPSDKDIVQTNFMDLGLFSTDSSFRGRSALVVQLWWIVQDWLIRPSPQFMYGWRRYWWRLFGAKLGAGVLIRPTARVQYPWKVTVGDRSWIGDQAELYSLGEIEIGKDAVISQHNYLCAGSHDHCQIDFPLVAKKIRVEDQVWIASGCFIAPGVTIGRGSIVAARSVVLEDVPPEKIYGGHPAKLLGDRPRPKTP